MITLGRLIKSKKAFAFAIVAAFAGGVGITILSDQVDTVTTYAIGDTGPAGGKIFILPTTSGNTTGKYFEAAPTGTLGVLVWCPDSSGELGGTGTAIGTGTENTATMLGTCTTDAAFQSDSYAVTNGSKTYDDWFLPSKDELNQLYLRRDSIGDFARDVYWSSSEASASTAWHQDFHDGNQGRSSKKYVAHVRPVRAFS